MKKILYLLLLVASQIVAQNKQILYNFAELPQTLLLNPALESNYNYHAGIPLLSGISSEIGSSGIVLTDLFAVDGRNINDRISSILTRISPRDFIKNHTQIEILNAGFRLDEKHYISFGFYQEIDAIGYVPRDFLLFFNEGNATNLNRSFSASQIQYKAEFLGVLHAGISKKIDEKLIIGARFKIYSSAINVQSTNNRGTLTTVNGDNSIYRHIFNNVNVNFRTAGLIENDEYIQDVNQHISNTFFGADANLGLGVDFGVNYKIADQLEFSASILDFGFINYSKNIKNTKTQGNFIFEGINFEYDPNNSVNYWNQLDQRFTSELPTTEDQESYISWRPTKFNAALKYSFGEQRRLLCYDDVLKDYYNNALGVQFFSVFRPLSPQLALTAFYERAITKKTRAKFTYTIDDFSYTNLGFGFSTQVSKLNFYFLVDNLLEFSNLSAANSMSFQLGFNLIFN